MLRVLQTARLHEWEAVLVSPASERPPLLHALHVLTVQLLVVDLLATSRVPRVTLDTIFRQGP